MKPIAKKALVAVLATALAAGLCASPALADEAHAATKKPYMKTLKVKWDLKKGRKVAVTSKWAGVGKQKATAVVKSLKTTKAKKAGYKKTTVAIEFNQTFKPTKKQVHKMVNNSFFNKYGHFGNNLAYAVVDYKTGKNLEVDETSGVTVKRGDWKYTKQKTYRDNDGCWAYFPAKISVKVTITYPKSYKNLCLGVMGNNKTFDGPTKADEKFWYGKTAFGKSTYYTTGKTNSHWMRIK